jgi:LPS-assembly lipoprotein
MTRLSSVRFVAAAVLSLVLSACGFHLRSALTLPPDLGPVRVVSSDPYSPLAESLALALQRAGAVPADEATAGDVATLELLSERWGDTPVSVDQFARAQEFSLRYAVVFSLRRADGTVLVPQQAVELARDYVAPPVDSKGKTGEREILARELRREMTAAIARRIDGASRGAVATDTAP